MLHNIFKKIKKTLKSKKIVPTIVADIHEKNSLVISELASSDNINLETRPLKIGDYIIGDVAIERKTVSDLISSMINKRLIQQLNQLKKYKQQMLIIEGDIYETLDENSNISKAVRGLILSIITNHQIPIIFTKDYEDTSKYLITLAKQQTKQKTIISLHSRIPKTLKEQKSYILESFPNIGPKTAQKLLKEFKTLEKIFMSNLEELEKILKSKAKKFKKIIES
ncbi:MAG: ERCC4 domain-containing protein [Nanoarchaeota archaeon]